MVLWNFSKSSVAALSLILSLLPSSFESEKFELVEGERVRYSVLCLVYFGGQSNDGGGAESVAVDAVLSISARFSCEGAGDFPSAPRGKPTPHWNIYFEYFVRSQSHLIGLNRIGLKQPVYLPRHTSYFGTLSGTCSATIPTFSRRLMLRLTFLLCKHRLQI
jgi:hypothetical protein